ncbi:hypothetical protein AQUCO_00200472v1 [Aquilegia coerulea]|uniref:Prolamin-like domain-containing protein n=1 Tax=Aquilegia coerulea TaxID=218851 RepID=A0A2G5F3B1_AQUCA|nr:hypothetical protein AQUCO_00200472v1 [Aquilegia coerulea]
MKATFLLFVMFVGACSAHTVSEESEVYGQQLFPFFGYHPPRPYFPWFRIPHHPVFPRPFPTPSVPAPSSPQTGSSAPKASPSHSVSGSSPSPDQCWATIRKVGTCEHQIFSSFMRGHVAISSECCAAINELSEDCSSPVFGIFGNPFFAPLIKAECSDGGKAAPTPA